MTSFDAENPQADLPLSAAKESPTTGGIMVPAHPLQPVVAGAWQTGVGSGPEILRNGFDPVWLLHSLRRRWILATGMGLLVGAIFAGFVWSLTPEEFEAIALLKVSSVQPTIAFDIGIGNDEVKFDVYRQTQMASVRGQFVIQAALRKQGIAQLPILAGEKDPIKFLQDELKVTYPFDGEIMQISLEAKTADEAEQLVDAVTDAYLEEVVDKEQLGRRIMYDQLERAYQGIREEIRKEMERYRTLAKSLGGSESETASVNRELVFNRLAILRREQDDAQRALLEANVAIQLLDLAKKTTDPVAVAVGEQMAADPVAQSMKSQAAQTEMQIFEARKAYKRPDHPRIKRLIAVRQQIEAELSSRQQEIYQQLAAQMANNPDLGYESALKGHRIRQKLYQSHLDELKQEFDSLIAEARDLAAQNVELEERQATLTGLNEMADTMHGKLEAWKIELAAAPRVTEIQSAIASPALNTIQRFVLVSLGGLFGAGLTCFGIAYWDFQYRRLNGPNQIRDGLGIRVVGSLPSLAFRKPTATADPVLAKLLESIDQVRTALMHASTTKKTRVVMITSATGQEGRSTVASQLAASLARAGRRTLLLDADLRHPTFHLLFGFPLEDGFCEVLRAETDVADVVRPTHAEGLWLLTAGNCDAEAIQALAQDQVQPIFDKLRAEYDFIIIDGAPVMSVSDSLILGQHVDGVLLSVMRDHSQVPNVYETNELLRSVGIRVIGAVVNGVHGNMDDRVAHFGLPGTATAAAAKSTATVEPAAAAKAD